MTSLSYKRSWILPLAAALIASSIVVLAPGACLAQGFMSDISPQEYTVSPGATASGTISVTSTAQEPVELRVYTADAVRGAEPAENYDYSEEPGAEPRSLLPWITFSPDHLTLQPGETGQVSYEIKVPTDATLSGSYWATIFVSNANASATLPVQPSEAGVGMGINIQFRYATFLSVTIKGTDTRELKFTELKLEQNGPWFDVTAAIQNTGNSIARPATWLEVRDTAGVTVYRGESSPCNVLPESTRLQKYEVRQPLPAGEYLLMAIADYGAPKLIAAQGRMKVDETSAKAMQEAYDAEQAAEAARAAEEAAAEGAEAPPVELPPGDENSGGTPDSGAGGQ